MREYIRECNLAEFGTCQQCRCLGVTLCFCEEPRRLLICQAELDGLLWSPGSFSGWCNATALHGHKGRGALTRGSENKESTDIQKHGQRKLGSGGRGSLMEKPQNPRNSACVLYTVDQGGGVIAKIWGRRQDLQYTAGSRREVYLISMGAFSVLSSGTKYLPGWGGLRKELWHFQHTVSTLALSWSKVFPGLSPVHSAHTLRTSYIQGLLFFHRVDRCFFFF